MAEASNSDKDVDDSKKVVEQAKSSTEKETAKTPSMTLSLFLTWILPVLILALVSRFGVDTEPPSVKVDKGSSRPISVDFNPNSKSNKNKAPTASPVATPYYSKNQNNNRGAASAPSTGQNKKQMMMMKKSSTPKSSPPTAASSHPTSYQGLIDDIASRKRVWKPKKASSGGGSNTSSSKSKSTATGKKKKTSSSSPSQKRPGKADDDPMRVQLDETIERRRLTYANEPTNVFHAIQLADALRHKDLKYHDGGMGQQEALQAYQFAISEKLAERKQLKAEGKPTNLSLSGTTSVVDELMFDYTQKSIDGLLCALYTNMGKLYFMANMFEKAVDSYSKCIDDIEPLYLDAVGSRGSSLIILGKYADAGRDYAVVIQRDHQRVFLDAFTGMGKVLVVQAGKEDAADNMPDFGWTQMVQIMEPMIDQYEEMMENGPAAGPDANPHAKKMVADALNRLHHVMFTYHDSYTKNRSEAWHHLTQSYVHKMSVVEPYNKAMEEQKLQTTKAVFHKSFWPDNIGSDTPVPIFIIGFVRSGSTLLERVLDAHPAIVGTGEDSVFNGRLDQIRDAIVKASLAGDMIELKEVVQEMADSVTDDMRERWKTIDANTAKDEDPEAAAAHPTTVEPERFADKMLTNYFNVGFIHMLFPNALILHVARNPMDVLWSAYKHEFPAGGLDYTSDFKSVAHMYHMYREVIAHWDEALPGRITHVRYEDLVHDMPGMAKAIIGATGLEWNDSVLAFHKKKHAVNTLSTTQVRKGIYKHSLEAWKKYETQLKPLAKLVGKESKWDLKTSLPSYSPPIIGSE